MDAETCGPPVPVFDRKRDLALYPDDALFVIPAGRLRLWGEPFDVHEPRPYTVAAVKAAAAAALGRSVAAMDGRWEDHLRKLAGEKTRAEEWQAELAAERALEKQEDSQLNPSRIEAMVAMHANAMTLQAIGDVFEISGSRVRQLLLRAKRKAERREQQQRDREQNAELEQQIIAELAAADAAERAARAKAKRARRVVDLQGVEPATNWRGPADEWLAIGLERAV